MAGSGTDSAQRERTLHRLEAFSDIVIAFSLSQLAFTLQIPHSGAELRAIQVVTFAASFALVCVFWWLHHQLFLRYFVPDIPSVVLNFAFLACTVLVVYSQQLMVRFDYGDVRAAVAYGLSFGCAYGLLAILFVKGLRDPRLTLDQDARRNGTRRAIRLAIVSGVLLASVLLAALSHSAQLMVTAWLAIPILILVQRLFEKKNPALESAGSQ